MSKTKVLHLINGADLGGISTFILTYYRRMDLDTIVFDFGMYDKTIGHNGKIMQSMGSDFFVLPSKKHIIKYYLTLRKILKNGEYDAIHAHTNTSSYVPLFIAKKRGIKIRVAHAHSAVKNRNFTYRLKAALAHILIPLYSTHMCACSTDAGDVVFGKRNKYILVPNAIETSKFAFDNEIRVVQRKKLGINNSTVVLGMVGRLSEEKNTQFSIECMKRIDSGMDIKLLIVGDGELRASLEKMVSLNKLDDKVIFLGNRSDVNDFYQVMDIFLLPSYFEGFPISALEAMANGLPIVLSDTITRDVSFGKNMTYLAINKENVDDWVDKILELSHDLRRSDGKEVMENGFDISTNVNVLDEIYKNKRKDG